jgi:hypothetical protein
MIPASPIIKVKLENRRKPTSPGHERAFYPKTQRPHTVENSTIVLNHKTKHTLL